MLGFHPTLSKLPVISKKCMTRECSTCHDMIDGFTPKSFSESLRYYQWKCTVNRIEKIVATYTVDIIFNELKKQLNTFLLHTFVKRERVATFNSLKSSSDGISIVLQVDFSDNAMIVAQKEVQSAHWHHSQATLFTAHAWINNDNNFSMVIISDDPNRIKYCIFVLCSAFFVAFKRNFQAYKLSIFSAMDQLLSLSKGFFFLICTTGSMIMISPSDGTSLPPPMEKVL